jgi:ATP-dependent RNA helicase RhlE
MLFSATMPNQIMKIASEYMALPIRIEVAPSGTAAENVEQEIIVIDREGKFGQLKKILTETKGSVLIFARTKHSVKNLTQKIRQADFSAAEIHSNRSLPQRREALNGFKLGQYRILIATDIAARGIDVKGIELVVNYDLPENSEDYVHRIGRTGRAGKSGKAISFALPSQSRDVRDIERLIKKTLNITKISSDLNARRQPLDVGGQRGARIANGPRGERGGRKPFRSDNKPGGFGGNQRRASGAAFGKSRGLRNQGGSAYRTGRSDDRPQRPMTDKERFRKSMRGERYR